MDCVPAGCQIEFQDKRSHRRAASSGFDLSTITGLTGGVNLGGSSLEPAACNRTESTENMPLGKEQTDGYRIQ